MSSQESNDPGKSAQVDRRTSGAHMEAERQPPPVQFPAGRSDDANRPPTIGDWLPPKSPASAWVSRMLPPKFVGAGGEWSVNSSAGQRTLRLPDGRGGFVEIDPNVVHVEADGQKIPIPLPDPRRRWRQRAIFNFIAMLICLAILYVCFLLIVPSR